MFSLLSRFGREYRYCALAGMCGKGLEVIFELVVPIIVARMIDVGVATRNAAEIVRLGSVLVLFSCIGYAATLICQKMAAHVSQGVGTQLRSELFLHINTLDEAYVNRIGAPSLLTRLSSDINQVQIAIALGIRQAVRCPFLALGSMLAALIIDWRLGLVFLVCTPLVALVFWVVMSRSVRYYSLVQARLDHVLTLARESLSGVRVIRAFSKEKYEEERFVSTAHSQAAVAIAVGKLSAILNPATMLIMDLGIVSILWAGSLRVSTGELSQGQIVAFVNYMTQTLLSLVYVANLVVLFNRAAASSKRLLEIFDTTLVLEDGPGIQLVGSDVNKVASSTVDDVCDQEAQNTPLLRLSDVSFRYDNAAKKYALSHISLELRSGQTLGIIGGTGSGKSTLIKLIARLFDVSSGSIEICGSDVRSWKRSELHRFVSVVPQHSSLISGSIRNNLSWRDASASDDELWEALRIAQADDFVRQKALGLDESVEAGGKNFSGGQRQRLTIARALVGHPQLLCLDDAASALDFATDAALRRSLKESHCAQSTIIVSQRVSAVMHADVVLVLDHGELCGLGTHEQLRKSCQIYQEICNSQLSVREMQA